MNAFLYMCCKTNASRAFHQAMASVRTDFLKYTQHDECNGFVVAATVGAKAILEDLTVLFTTHQVQDARSVNLWKQTPLHVAILGGHLPCIPLLATFEPRWFHVPDAYRALPTDYMMHLYPSHVEAWLRDMQSLPFIVNAITGNSLVHSLCTILPDNFSTLLRLLPTKLLSAVNHHGHTPAMMLVPRPSVRREHFHAMMQHGSSATTPATRTWWTQVDDQGHTVLHLALIHKLAWVLKLTDLTAFRSFQLLHMAAELGLASAVTLLVQAGFSPLESLRSGATPSETSNSTIPIMLASTPSCVLELLRVETLAQLECVVELSRSSRRHGPSVYRVLHAMVIHVPLFDFVQSVALANPRVYLSSNCLFLQRFRKCLRLDVKLLQLSMHVAGVLKRMTGRTTLTIPSDDKLWTSIQQQSQRDDVDWNRPVTLYVVASKAVYLTTDDHMWKLLAMQLRQLGPHLFDMSLAFFSLLGKLLGHMVLVGQKLPQSVLPPLFLNTPAEFKPELAAAFKAGMDLVMGGGALDNWNGFERFALLHRVVFLLSFDQWKHSKVHYDAPFHPNHPTILNLWIVLENHLVPVEQLIWRLRCGQPFRITPAPIVGIVEKDVLGVPEDHSLDKLQLDVVLFLRGLRKQPIPTTDDGSSSVSAPPIRR
ncbi:hypothetical protein DYB36_000700 [Aphanomyces astaci]|uniref:Uncharacterized protein n=1 Tax=Aphanomyces astaci TaxID=112090 RepID=A0A397BCL4_APHAT|nr:hypothetical protein DYB36_000700 [Aphanomyces astaci]